MSTSRDRGRATRSRILEATAQLIAEEGWSGFSTRDIAARAGVTQGIVSYHWRSKGELVREAALRATAEMLAPAGDALEQAPNARAALERILGLADAFRADPHLTLLLFETMLQAGRDAGLREALAEMIRDFRNALAAALAREGAGDPAPAAAALTAAFDGLFLHAVVDDELDIQAAGAALLRLADPLYAPPADRRG